MRAINLLLTQVESRSPTEWEVPVSVQGRKDCQVYERQVATLSIPYNVNKNVDGISWYIEDFATKESFKVGKAADAVQALQELGKSLQHFLQELDDRTHHEMEPEVLGRHDDLAVSLFVVADGTTSSIHSLPWELLENPQFWPRGFKIGQVSRCTSVTERSPSALPQALNVLVLTSRPAQKDDITYRAVSQHIWELAQQASAEVRPVNVVLVRPGTWSSFCSTLHSHREGLFHIVHIDTHGDVQESTGKSVIHFTSEFISQTLPDPITAEEFALELKKARVECVVLNACFSATTRGANPHGNFAHTLASSGIAYVVAMAYKAKLDTTTLFVRDFYKHLFLRKKDVRESITMARRFLREHPNRQGRYAEKIVCCDWHSIVLYQRTPEALPDEVYDFLSRDIGDLSVKGQNDKYASNDSKNEPLVSSDIDMLILECSLADSPIAVLCGDPGVGKTSLINDLCRWWEVSKFADPHFLPFSSDSSIEDLLKMHEIIIDTARSMVDDLPEDGTPILYIFDGWDKLLLAPETRATTFEAIRDLFSQLDEMGSSCKAIFVTSVVFGVLEREMSSMSIPVIEKSSLYSNEVAKISQNYLHKSRSNLENPDWASSFYDLVERTDNNLVSVRAMCAVLEHDPSRISLMNSISLPTQTLHIDVVASSWDVREGSSLSLLAAYMRELFEGHSPVFYLMLSLCSFQQVFPIMDASIWLYQLYAFPLQELVNACGWPDQGSQEVEYEPQQQPPPEWFFSDEHKVLKEHWNNLVERLMLSRWFSTTRPDKLSDVEYLHLQAHFSIFVCYQAELLLGEKYQELSSSIRKCFWRFYAKRSMILLSANREFYKEKHFKLLVMADCEESNLCEAGHVQIQWHGFPLAFSPLVHWMKLARPPFKSKQRKSAWATMLNLFQARFQRIVSNKEWDDKGIRNDPCFRAVFAQYYYGFSIFHLECLAQFKEWTTFNALKDRVDSTTQYFTRGLEIGNTLQSLRLGMNVVVIFYDVVQNGVKSENAARIAKILNEMPQNCDPNPTLRIDFWKSMIIQQLLHDDNTQNFRELSKILKERSGESRGKFRELCDTLGLNDLAPDLAEGWELNYDSALQGVNLGMGVSQSTPAEASIYDRIQLFKKTLPQSGTGQKVEDSARFWIASNEIVKAGFGEDVERLDKVLDDILEIYDRSISTNNTRLRYKALSTLSRISRRKRNDFPQQIRFELLLEEMEKEDEERPGEIDREENGVILLRKHNMCLHAIPWACQQEPEERCSTLNSLLTILEAAETLSRNNGMPSYNTNLLMRQAAYHGLWLGELQREDVDMYKFRDYYQRCLAMECRLVDIQFDTKFVHKNETWHIDAILDSAFRHLDILDQTDSGTKPDQHGLRVKRLMALLAFEVFKDRTGRSLQEMKSLLREVRRVQGTTGATDRAYLILKWEAQMILMQPDDKLRPPLLLSSSLLFWARDEQQKQRWLVKPHDALPGSLFGRDRDGQDYSSSSKGIIGFGKTAVASWSKAKARATLPVLPRTKYLLDGTLAQLNA